MDEELGGGRYWGLDEVLVAWIKSCGLGGGAGCMDEELEREKVLVAWIKSLGVGEQAGGVNEEWRRCWRLDGGAWDG